MKYSWWWCDEHVFNYDWIKYSAIDTDDYLGHGYYIIKFSSSPYTLQVDLIIDGQVIPSDEIVCEGTHFFPININSHYYFLQKKTISTNVSLRKIINGSVNVYVIIGMMLLHIV